MLLAILGVFLVGCVSDPERLAPPRDFKTGLANYLSEPLDVSELADDGYKLEKGWNIFVWPADYGGVKVEDFLSSVEGLYYYVYNYDKGEFYFPSEGKYSKLRIHSYYSEKLFDTLESGNSYGIYVIREGTLRYG